MAEAPFDAVATLARRLGFLEGIKEIATHCNWSEENMQELQQYLLEEIVKIDNIMFEVYDQTLDVELTCSVWEDYMENLRYWIQLILGVKVKFI